MNGKALVVLCALLVAAVFLSKYFEVKEPDVAICLSVDGGVGEFAYGFESGYAVGITRGLAYCNEDEGAGGLQEKD